MVSSNSSYYHNRISYYSVERLVSISCILIYIYIYIYIYTHTLTHTHWVPLSLSIYHNSCVVLNFSNHFFCFLFHYLNLHSLSSSIISFELRPTNFSTSNIGCQERRNQEVSEHCLIRHQKNRQTSIQDVQVSTWPFQSISNDCARFC